MDDSKRIRIYTTALRYAAQVLDDPRMDDGARIILLKAIVSEATKAAEEADPDASSS